MLLFSLTDSPRSKLLEWYEDVCAQARGLCAAFDIAGALSLVAFPPEWNAYPGNLLNAADVLANGDQLLPLQPRPRRIRRQNARHILQVALQAAFRDPPVCHGTNRQQ